MKIRTYSVMLKSSTGAFILIPEGHPEMYDYVQQGYVNQYSGVKRDCLKWIENYWDENLILEEEQIFATVK